MATDIMAVVQFSDGTFGNFVKEGATAETVTSVPRDRDWETLDQIPVYVVKWTP